MRPAVNRVGFPRQLKCAIIAHYDPGIIRNIDTKSCTLVRVFLGYISYLPGAAVIPLKQDKIVRHAVCD